jgi:hypothetical protein
MLVDNNVGKVPQRLTPLPTKLRLILDAHRPTDHKNTS